MFCIELHRQSTKFRIWRAYIKIQSSRNNLSLLWPFSQASFTLSRCTPRCVPAVCSRRTGANRNESGKNSSVFIYSRQCYEPDPVWGKTSSRYVPVMLRFATVHSRCSSGGATVCPGASRYTTVVSRESVAEPRCHYGESRK